MPRAAMLAGKTESCFFLVATEPWIVEISGWNLVCLSREFQQKEFSLL